GQLAAGRETADRDQRLFAVARLAGNPERGNRDARARGTSVGFDAVGGDRDAGLDPLRGGGGRNLLELTTCKRGLRRRDMAGGDQKDADESDFHRNYLDTAAEGPLAATRSEQREQVSGCCAVGRCLESRVAISKAAS
ncbi:hypothetical protein ABG067_008511, partial [Albugo candida]